MDKILLNDNFGTQGCMGAWYVFNDDGIKVLLTVLLFTGLYVLLYVWIQFMRRWKV